MICAYHLLFHYMLVHVFRRVISSHYVPSYRLCQKPLVVCSTRTKQRESGIISEAEQHQLSTVAHLHLLGSIIPSLFNKYVWLWDKQWAMGWTVTGKPSFPGPCPQQPCSQVRETTLKQRGPQADITVNDIPLNNIRLGYEQRESKRGCLRLKVQGCPLEEAELKVKSANDHKLATGKMGRDSQGQKRTWWSWKPMAPMDQSECRTAWDEAAEAVKC